MGTYYIPRNYKGETRILYVFTVKSLVTTVVGGLIGAGFYFLFSLFGLNKVGIVILAICALLGWAVGALKIPTVVGIPVTKKIGGESLGDIIIRYIKFKRSRKIYTYIDTKEEEK